MDATGDIGAVAANTTRGNGARLALLACALVIVPFGIVLIVPNAFLFMPIPAAAALVLAIMACRRRAFIGVLPLVLSLAALLYSLPTTVFMGLLLFSVHL
jgi:hypothetical protein